MSGRPLTVIGGSKFHTESEHYAVGGQGIRRPSGLSPEARKFWDVVVPHLHFMALASKADEPELKQFADAYSDWTTTGSSRASLEFSRLAEGFRLEPAKGSGPFSNLGLQVKRSAEYPEYYMPEVER